MEALNIFLKKILSELSSISKSLKEKNDQNLQVHIDGKLLNESLLKGKDAKTPQKGVDYFTEKEIDSIAEKAASLVTKPNENKILANLKQYFETRFESFISSTKKQTYDEQARIAKTVYVAQKKQKKETARLEKKLERLAEKQKKDVRQITIRQKAFNLAEEIVSPAIIKLIARGLEKLKGNDKLSAFALRGLPSGGNVIVQNDSGVSSREYEIPIGAVNGVNKLFTFSEKPAFINVDGVDKFEDTNYTYDDDLNRAELYTAPEQNIVGIFETIVDLNGIPFADSDSYVGTGSAIDIDIGFDMTEESGNQGFVMVKAAASGTDREMWWRYPFNWHRRADRFTTANSRGYQPLTFTSTGFRVDEELSANGVTFHYFAYLDNGSNSILGSSFHGNATAGRVIQPVPGLAIAAALIKRDSTQPSVWAFGPDTGTALARTWEGNSSDVVIGEGPDADKMTIGDGDEINQWESTYGEGIHAICFAKNNPNIHVTRYTGNGTARTIDLPWQPAVIFIVPFTPPTGATTMRTWFKSLGSSGSLPVSSGAGVISGEITNVDDSGFSIGTGNPVNQNGIVYGVIAVRYRPSSEASNVIPTNLQYKSTATIPLTGGYIDCGTDDSLSITGPMTIAWEGSVSNIPLNLASIVNSGDINDQANTQFPLLFRSGEVADAQNNAVSYGLELAAGQTTQPDVSTDPWLGATVVVATRSRFEMLYGGPANLDQFPMNTGVLQSPDARTMIIVTTDGNGKFRVYKDRKLIKFRDRSVGSNIASNSGDRLVIGARQRDDGIVFPTTMEFHRARIYDYEFTHQQCLDGMMSPYVGYPDLPDDHIEGWHAADRVGDTLPAEVNSANNGTIYETAPPAYEYTDTPDLLAYYDPTDNTSYTTSGGEVTQLNDKSGNGYHLTGGAAGTRPTTGSDGVGNYLAFATDDRLSVSIPTPSAMTVFAVVAPTNAGAGDTARGQTLGFENNFSYFAMGGGNSTLSGETFSFIANSDRLGAAEAAYDWSADETYVEITSVGASGSTLRKNGGAAVSLSLGTSGIDATDNLAPGNYLGTPSTMRVGIGWNGVALFGPYTGKLRKLLIYSRQLSVSEMNDVREKLAEEFPSLTLTTIT